MKVVIYLELVFWLGLRLIYQNNFERNTIKKYAGITNTYFKLSLIIKVKNSTAKSLACELRLM